MGTSHSTTNRDALLKDVYTEDKLKEQSFGENPFYAMVRKERGRMAGGRRYVQPVEFANPSGASSDFATAMTVGTASSYEDFLINRKKQYQRVQVDNELWFASEKKSDSFTRALEEFDRGLKSLGEKIGRRLYRTSGGSIAKLAIGSTTTTTLSFSDNAAVFNFHIGQLLAFSATDGTGSLLDSGDTVTVTAVDHEAGTVTINTDLATQIAGVATTSYVFPKGDYGLGMSGLEDWLPVDDRATKLAASFHSVTRSSAPVYMGGVQMDGTTMGGLDEVIIKLVGKIGKYGGQTSHIFANPESLSDLELLSNSKMRIVAEINTQIKGSSGEVLVGFSGYKAMVGGRTVTITADRNCPSNRLYALQLNTWTLWHTGEFINWLGEEATGQRLMLSENDDASEARLGAYQNLGCSAPGWNGVAKINAAT